MRGGIGPGDNKVGIDYGQRNIQLFGDVATAAGVRGAGGQALRQGKGVADAPVVDVAVEFLALADREGLGTVEALDADDVPRAVGLSPLGGDDVVEAVWSQEIVAEFPAGLVGRVASDVDDDGAAGGALVEQLRQGVEAVVVVAVLADRFVVVSLGDEIVTAVRIQCELAASFCTEHVGDVIHPFGCILIWWHSLALLIISPGFMCYAPSFVGETPA